MESVHVDPLGRLPERNESNQTGRVLHARTKAWATAVLDHSARVFRAKTVADC